MAFESGFLPLEHLNPFHSSEDSVSVSTVGSNSASFSLPLSSPLPLKDDVEIKNHLCICLEPSLLILS